MKLSLILNVIDPKIGGVMIMGEGELHKLKNFRTSYKNKIILNSKK